MGLKQPYKNEIPPLAEIEFEALRADLKNNGQLSPVIVDEDENILDGHNRYKILRDDVKTKTVRGLSDGQKLAYVHRHTNNRRNLSMDQKAELRKRQQEIAKQLREEDVKRWTQKAVAAELGVARETVRNWFTNNGQKANAGKPDARVALSKEGQQKVVELVEAGKTQEQAAADLGVSQQTVSNILKRETKEKEKRKASAKAARTAAKIEGVVHGDFREVADEIPDGTADLVFTDPPWDRKSMHLYEHVGYLADRVLCDGGSLLIYTGQRMIPDAIDLISESGLRWYWICADYRHKPKVMNRTGQKVRMMPILWFIKGSERFDTSSIVEDVHFDDGPEKCTHDWQQGIASSIHFIERLSRPKSLVVDPFCGGGTTATAAATLGRKFWTCDIDKNTTKLAMGRIANAISK